MFIAKKKYRGRIVSAVNLAKGSYTVELTSPVEIKEVAAAFAELQKKGETKTKTLLYGENGNLVYRRAGQSKEYPEGCDFGGEVCVTFGVNAEGWVETIVSATDANRLAAQQQAVERQHNRTVAKQAIADEADEFGVTSEMIATLGLAAKYGVSVTELIAAKVALTPKPVVKTVVKPQPKPQPQPQPQPQGGGGIVDDPADDADDPADGGDEDED